MSIDPNSNNCVFELSRCGHKFKLHRFISTKIRKYIEHVHVQLNANLFIPYLSTFESIRNNRKYNSPAQHTRKSFWKLHIVISIDMNKLKQKPCTFSEYSPFFVIMNAIATCWKQWPLYSCMNVLFFAIDKLLFVMLKLYCGFDFHSFQSGAKRGAKCDSN